MPSPVPAGFTRGPIMFIGQIQSTNAEATLLQHLWDEAGSYGARIVIVTPAGPIANPDAERCAALLADWESDSVTVLTVKSRGDAMQPSTVQTIQAATAILLLGNSPLHLASILGGTPLAQAIRRANAQSKMVCAVGGCASILCQHMITFDSTSTTSQPVLHRQRVQFAPGLGIVNRVALDAALLPSGAMQEATSRLLTAVAYNPFLVGMSLDQDTGAVIYPDATMEIFGEHNALLVDGATITYSNLHEAEPDLPVSVLGTQTHLLRRGDTFNFDTRQVQPPLPDSAMQREAVKAAF